MNDLEERPPCGGCCNNLLDCEFVAFGVETTGLERRDGPADRDKAPSSSRAAGAGQVQHFRGPKNANPGKYHGADRHPDSDVAGAPLEAGPCAPSWTSWAAGP